MPLNAEPLKEPVPPPHSPPLSRRQQKGEAFERIAFSLCKIATFCLFTQKFALPLAAMGAAGFFALALWNGKNDTQCWARKPLLIAAFWVGVAGIWIWRNWPLTI